MLIESQNSDAYRAASMEDVLLNVLQETSSVIGVTINGRDTYRFKSILCLYMVLL